MRLSPEELELVDILRRSADRELSRAELLRSLLRDKRRSALDAKIATAYDDAPPGDDGLGEASARAASEALRGL